MESVKPQKTRMCDHLVSSRDESSKCPNMNKTGRDVSIIDGCISLVSLLKTGTYTVKVNLVFTCFLLCNFIFTCIIMCGIIKNFAWSML